MDKILQTVFDTPELYKLLVPEGINAYGIMLGGSRFLNFDTDASDYDLNILVSPSDYQKLEAEHNLRPSIYIGDVHIHWYYWPTNLRFFNFESGSFAGLIWWTAAMLQGITEKSFLKVIDENGIKTFLNLYEKNQTLLKNLMKDKYYIYYNKLPQDDRLNNVIWKKTYLHLYIGSLVNNTTKQDFNAIKEIKKLTSDIEFPLNNKKTPVVKLSEEQLTLIKNLLNSLILWLKN